MIIGACGFSGSGSSAVVDLLKECDNFNILNDAEFYLSYYPDGLEDLDYHLNAGFSKYSSSVVAIERFRIHMYNYVIHNERNKEKKKKIIDLTESFISSITQVKWHGYGGSDYQLYSGRRYKSKYVNMFYYKVAKRILPRISNRINVRLECYPVHDMEFSILPESFDEKARKFVEDLLEILGTTSNQKIVLNQPFAGNYPQKSFKFFNDPYAIVVDRDPRDVFLIAKMNYRYMGLGYQIPTDNVEDFAEYYKRLHYKQPYLEENERVLPVHFEDMIYKYNETISGILEFCRADSHQRKGEFFNPKRSINNTQLFTRFPQFEKEVRYIEETLPEYLYPFEMFGKQNLSKDIF